MNDSVERREIHYRGMVQGVGFRYTTRRVAGEFRVTGFVQNQADGRVRVVVQGTAGEIDGFLDAVESQLAHYITDKEQETLGPVGNLGSFEIRFQ